jgi:hypothetical protein
LYAIFHADGCAPNDLNRGSDFATSFVIFHDYPDADHADIFDIDHRFLSCEKEESQADSFALSAAFDFFLVVVVD